ncbi:MAG TPA: pyruvate kinase [Candidatus Acidoferrales bacterium]|nr:pyruvate kinase [Candidatus Acidoferrales bacterium]
MGTNYEGAGHVDNLPKLITELRDLRSEVVRIEKDFERKTREIQQQHKQSAKNFLHYLALRQRDLRPMQERLARFGLSSLGRSESHVLANLDAVLKALNRMACSESELLEPQGSDFTAGKSTLERNTTALLGPKPAGRDVRIMVTMAGEAATDYLLVRNLVAAGMDCMRINCAHDDERAWAGMVENLQRARKELKRDCRILMDLPGPKLRTGPIDTLPGVVKWQPRRDRYGRITEVAHVWLAPKETFNHCPADADACLPVPGEWLKNLPQGATIKFLDTRGRSRALIVREISENGCWADAAKTAYVSHGTLLQVIKENGKTPSDGVACIEDLPAELQPIRLKTGDILILNSKGDLGRPAVYDSDGKILQAPSVSVTLPEIFADVRAGEPIWFDDGKIGGVIRSANLDEIKVEITMARPKGERLWADKGINLPESKLRLPALTEEDVAHLPFIVSRADLVGYSFVRSDSDIAELQNHLQRLDGAHLGVILKIETRQAFEELPHLVLAAMRGHAAGIMIARGDLAVECGYERTGELQEEIMWIAEAAHMPVIWATQVLETVAKTGQPSRAEITDAAMAERAECVMLNKGPYVVQAVQMLDDVLRRMQSHQTKKVSLLRQLQLANRFCRREAI